MRNGAPDSIEVFVSYAHEDEPLCRQLLNHLSMLKRSGAATTWYDRAISAGSEWDGEIGRRLNAAEVIILLISSDFLASHYCYEKEMTRALERHDAGEARVVPVILRPVDWEGAPFARLQAVPKDATPATSWSNQDEAFTDIAKGVRQAIEEIRRKRPTAGHLPRIWHVPHLRNPHFTGRDTLLDDLHASLTSGRVALTAARGMGGVGKTQLALEYAYRHASEFDLVWWLRAEEPATLLADYAMLAEPLRLPQAGERELAAIAQAVCLELARRDRWLLVFDNANEPKDLEPLLPRGGGGRVLITSRAPTWPLAQPLDVPVLDRPAAVAFLRERIGQDDETAAEALAEELGDLPLALEQAAAYMADTGLALADYLALFHTRRRELWAEEKPPEGRSDTVGTTWTMAVERLRAEEPAAVALLNLCAFLAPEAIPRKLLVEHHAALPPELGEAVADPLRLNRLVGALRRYSLVQVTGEGLSFHRLVQAATRDGLTEEEQQRWAGATVALMNAGFPYDRDDPATWAASGALLAHALAAVGHAAEVTPELEGARRLLNQTARYLETRAEFAQARAGYARALELAEAALGPDDPEVATYVNDLGMVLRAQGDLAGARAAFERALRIHEATLGPDHPEVATNVNNLGLALHDLGELAEAQAAFERALRIHEAAFGPDHPNVAVRVNNLGMVLREQGKLAGARAAFERALRIDEAAYRPDHPSVARDVNNLGLVLQHLGDLAGARAAFERALKIDEVAYGPEHPNVAIRVNNLGMVLREQGELTGARTAFERALAIFERALGPEHPNVATLVNNLGSVLHDLGDLAGARAAFERALRIDEAAYGPDHPSVARDVNNLGRVLRDAGELAGARAGFERALAIFERFFPADHPHVVKVRNNLQELQEEADRGSA